jgi:hypothetical protein
MNQKRWEVVLGLIDNHFSISKTYEKVYGVAKESAQVLATGLLKNPKFKEAVASLIISLDYRSPEAEKLLIKVIEP